MSLGIQKGKYPAAFQAGIMARFMTEQELDEFNAKYRNARLGKGFWTYQTPEDELLEIVRMMIEGDLPYQDALERAAQFKGTKSGESIINRTMKYMAMNGMLATKHQEVQAR
jgi:hypothetical protein